MKLFSSSPALELYTNFPHVLFVFMKTKSKAPRCECGCGGATKGGRFLPGHDAKLKKELLALARSGKKRALKRLQKLGWSG